MFVYLITSDDAVKVGFTRLDPEQRLRALQTGNGHRLQLQGWFRFKGHMTAMRAEKVAQKIAGSMLQRMAGEWFRTANFGDVMSLAMALQDHFSGTSAALEQRFAPGVVD